MGAEEVEELLKVAFLEDFWYYMDERLKWYTINHKREEMFLKSICDILLQSQQLTMHWIFLKNVEYGLLYVFYLILHL